MNIGLVSPYDFATQGGVTEHITHLAKQLRAAGHTVKILAPYSTDKGDVPDDVYALGAVTPVPANGSVTHLALAPSWAIDSRHFARRTLRYHPPARAAYADCTLARASLFRLAQCRHLPCVWRIFTSVRDGTTYPSQVLQQAARARSCVRVGVRLHIPVLRRYFRDHP